VLALFSLGYTWSIVRRRRNWPDGMARVNVAMGWVMLGILLLINTPVLDFRAISTRSQIARVESGEIQPIEFDFRYAQEMLARPGYFAAQRLIEQLGFDPLADRASPVAIVHREGVDEEQGRELAAMRDAFWQNVVYRGGPFSVPDGVRAVIDREIHRTEGVEHPTLVPMELDGDSAQTEYLILGVHRFDMPAFQGMPARVHYSPVALAVVDAGPGWGIHGLSGSGGGVRPVEDAGAVVQELREGLIQRVPRRYDDLRIGSMLFGFRAGAGEVETTAAPSEVVEAPAEED